MDYHSERGGVPLHAAVEVNCNMGTSTENQGSGAWPRCLLDYCVGII